MLGEHLGGLSHDPGQGNDRHGGGKKERSGRRVDDVLEDEGDGHEDEKEQKHPIRLQLREPTRCPPLVAADTKGVPKKEAPSGFEPE